MAGISFFGGAGTSIADFPRMRFHSAENTPFAFLMHAKKQSGASWFLA